MNKYNILALINVVWGFILIIIPVLTLLMVIPAINNISLDFNVPATLPLSVYVLNIILIGMGVINLTIAGLLVTGKKKQKDKLFSEGLAILVISLIFSAIFGTVGDVAAVSSIYNIANQF